MKESNDTRDITFDFIYEKYGRLVMEIALRVLKNIDLAEDAVQDALFAISQNMGKLHGESKKTRNYIINIARNAAIDIYRENKRKLEYEIPLETDDEDDEISDSGKRKKELSTESFEKELFAKYDRLKVLSSLEKMEDNDKIYIKEYFYEELAGKKIAEKHGISEQAAWKRIYRSIDKLKEIFLEGGE